jgi:RNA polymerase sigma-70 factor (ECF subfamily)
MRLAGDTDDVACIRRARAGERDAFEHLVRQTARMLYARLYLEVGDRDRAEDLLQETYLVAWRSIRQLDDVADASAFRRWLFSIARTVRIDSARRQTRQKRGGSQDPRPADSADGDYADPAPGPDEQAERQERHDRLLSLVRSLPEEYRLPISMRYLAGADYPAICRQLGLTGGSLRGLLNRGMTRLRQLMGAARDDA